jgi:hypothetical protein
MRDAWSGNPDTDKFWRGTSRPMPPVAAFKMRAIRAATFFEYANKGRHKARVERILSRPRSY